MKRNGLVVIFVVVLCLGAVLAFLPRLGGDGCSSSEGLRFVPMDAAYLVRINDWQRLSQASQAESGVWPALCAGDGAVPIDSILRRVGAYLARHDAKYQALMRGESLFSWHSLGNKQLAWLGVLRCQGGGFSLEELAECIFAKEWHCDSIRDYSGTQILRYVHPMASGTANCYMAKVPGALLLSGSSLLMERAIRQGAAKGGLPDDPILVNLYGAASQREVANIFIQPSRSIPHFANVLQTPWQQAFAPLNDWAPWIALDCSLDGNIAAANGFSRLADSISQGSNRMEALQPTPLSVTEIIPDQCPFFIRWGTKSPDGMPALLSGAPGNSSNETRQTNRRSGADLLQEAQVNEIALAYVPTSRDQANWAIVLFPKSVSAAQALFAAHLAERATPNASQQNAVHTKKLEIDRGVNLTYFESPDADFFHEMYGKAFPKGTSRYFATIDRFLLFASDQQTLREVAVSQVRGRVLKSAPRWDKLRNDLQSECNFMLYATPTSWSSLPAALFAQNAIQSRTMLPARLQAMGALTLQVSAGRGIVFYNTCIHPGGASGGTSRTVWETRLEAPVLGRPLLMASHIAKGKEVLVQDTSRTLYLVSGVGRVLWRKPLPDNILGEPQQVDLYRNGKLQYIFTTPSAIWAVDRNGNNVEGFPVQLPSEATAPLAVLDYDNSRNYRFVVPCADRSILMFDNRGHRVVGFSPERTEEVVRQPVQFVRIQGKDYLVYSDANRLYIMNRRGQERVACAQPVRRAEMATIDFERTGAGHLVTIDSEGHLCKVSLANGSVTRSKLKQWQSGAVAELVDIDADGLLEIIMVGGRTVACIGQSGAVRFTKQFKGPLAPGVQVYHFGGNDWRIGLLEEQAERMWLLRADGAVSAGFPLPGNTPFSIGHLEQSEHQFNLIAGGYANLLLNYAIDE